MGDAGIGVDASRVKVVEAEVDRIDLNRRTHAITVPVPPVAQIGSYILGAANYDRDQTRRNDECDMPPARDISH